MNLKLLIFRYKEFYVVNIYQNTKCAFV